MYQLGCSAVRNIGAATGPLTRLATPFYAISLAKELCSISTFIFIGHSSGGAHALGAVTLACMIANVTGYSLCYGFNTSLDTIMSQSFGARSFRAAALYSEAAVIVMTLACLPIITLWWHSSYVLYYVMNIPLSVALNAQTWTRIVSFGLWPCLVSDVLRRWLQGQQVTTCITASDYYCTYCTHKLTENTFTCVSFYSTSDIATPPSLLYPTLPVCMASSDRTNHCTLCKH